MVNNPYIELVKKHENILTDTEKIYSHSGTISGYFENTNPLILEIGTGLGNFFSREVYKKPHCNFVGMEIKYKRLYITAEKSLGNLNNYADNGTRPKRILKKIERQNSTDNNQKEKNTNFVLIKDFGENIDKIFGEEDISLSYIFFPDPWSKKKRWLKNRLLQTPFLNNLYKITTTGGRTIIKTDHLDYYNFVLHEVKKTPWKIIKQSNDWEAENEFQNTETTEFQQLFRGQKIKINYLELEK